MSLIAVRPATPADAPVIALIMAESFLADQARYIPEPLDPAYIRDYSDDLAARRWPAMLIASHGGNPAGMLYAELNQVDALNILPHLKRRGLGAALMDRLESDLAARGFTEVTLDTQEANAPARAFYEARGYRVTHRWAQTAFTRNPVPMVAMARSLTPRIPPATPGPARAP